MSNYTVYAFKGDSDWAETVLKSLREGEGRFGWSYCKTADLHKLKKKIAKTGWDSLNEDEKDCYQSVLLDLKAGDYIVYINVPEYGKCTLARVTGSYYWKHDDDDFNHRFPVDATSVAVFDRNDDIVHPALSARLKLPGRYWRIYTISEFESLLEELKSGKVGKPRTLDVNIKFLSKEIRPLFASITEKIHNTHPNYDLEKLFAEVLKNVPGVKEVKLHEKTDDHGADLLAIIEHGLPILGQQQQDMCVIQVKSYKGEHWDTQAVKDIERAFDHYPEAGMGLIISTAISSTESLDNALEKLRTETGKPIGLMIGSDVAAFLLRYGGHLVI